MLFRFRRRGLIGFEFDSKWSWWYEILIAFVHHGSTEENRRNGMRCAQFTSGSWSVFASSLMLVVVAG